MTTLSIQNFGPIKSFKADISKVNILIGPQASGKSTVAKVIYYIKMFPTWLATFMPAENSVPKLLQFQKFLSSKFIILFSSVYHENMINIRYEFFDINSNEKNFIYIYQSNTYEDKNYITIKFDKQLDKKIENFFDEVLNIQNKKNNGVVENRNLRYFHRDITQKTLMGIANSIFTEPQAPIFIPAGRSLLTLLSGQFTSSLKFSDFIMEDFLNIINDIRPQVGQGLIEAEDIAKNTWQQIPDKESAHLAREEIEKILRGKYSYANGEERIYHGSKHTKLSVASSGQQESLWVILLSYMLILEKSCVFAVFEEPEAHLYPESQYAIIRLLALLSNSNPNNQIFITTHSPYVLVALNNLLAAGCVGQKNMEQVGKIINQNYWLNVDEVQALAFHEDGTAYDIMDKNLCMIKAEEIDHASSIMNEEYDKIISFE